MNYETHVKKFEDYLIANSKSKETTGSYKRTIRQFLKLINKNPEDIDEEDLQKYKLYAVKHYNTNTLTPKYSAVNTFMKYIGKSKDWREDHKLKPPKKYTPNKIPLTEKEIKGLFKVSRHNLRDNAILKVFYYGLLRRTELQNLNMEDVDEQKNKLRINAGKGNKYATVNLHPDAIQSIIKYLEIREPKNPDEGALFLNIYGKRIGKTDIALTIKRYTYKLGLSNKRVYPHLFRISGITHMAQKGVNLKIIQQQSRHTDIETLLGYIQPTDEEVKDGYLKGITLGSEYKDEEKTEKTIPEPSETKPIKKRENENTTDKYIALLRDGLIGKEEFISLMYLDKKPVQQSPYIQ